VSASAVVDSDEAELYKIDRVFVFSLFVADKELFARFYQIIGAMLAERIVNLPLTKAVSQIKSEQEQQQTQPTPRQMVRDGSGGEVKSVIRVRVQCHYGIPFPNNDLALFPSYLSCCLYSL
jgi:hypothetical protein